MLKKILKIFYILIVLGALGALLYKEGKLIKELTVLRDEKVQREQTITENINDSYHPRKEDFYKNEK